MPIVNLRKDAVHAQDTIGEIQYLVDLASSNKEEFDYTLDYLQKQIIRAGAKLKEKRENLIAFMDKHGIGYKAFPIMFMILTDDVLQDTVPEQNLSAVPVESAMKKNIPNELFNLLKSKIGEKVTEELNYRIDEIKKMKLHKAWLERANTNIINAKKEYEKNEAAQGDNFQNIRKDLEDQLAIHKSLSEFKYLFSNTPQVFTSAHFGAMHDNRVDRYCAIYVAKKKSITQQAEKIKGNYDDVTRYAETSTSIDSAAVVGAMTDVSKYFGEQGDTPSDKILPAQYVDAYQKKQDVIRSVESFLKTVATIISSIKAALDAIRNVTGLGNKEIEGLVTQALAVAQSPVNARKIEQTTLTQVQNENSTILAQTQRKAEEFKGWLQRGVNSLDSAFLKAQKDFLLKMTLNMGFPVSIVKDRDQHLEDHVREKVRAKFGHIPYEDEEVIIENGVEVFVKKTDLDPKTKLRKTTVEGASLVEKTLGIRRV